MDFEEWLDGLEPTEDGKLVFRDKSSKATVSECKSDIGVVKGNPLGNSDRYLGFSGGKRVDNGGESGIIKVDKSRLEKYIGKPISETDNQHVREWYYANVSDIQNQIDRSKSLEEQAMQAFNLRNKYKHEARVAMSDEETAKMLEKKRPIPTFKHLLEDKMKRKNMTRQEALEDIIKTASKTNQDVNKEFGL